MNTNCAGFSLITAVFLLVVVALLGTYMVTIGTTQRMTSTLSVLSTRAMFAADSGMEWARAYVLKNDACFSAPAGNFTLTGGAAGGYAVTDTCTSMSVTEGADTYNVFKLKSTASRGSIGSPDYVQRSLRATVTTAP